MTGVIITVDLKEREREREGEKSDPIHGKGSIFHVSEQAAERKGERERERFNQIHPTLALDLDIYIHFLSHGTIHLHTCTYSLALFPFLLLSSYGMSARIFMRAFICTCEENE